MSHRVRSCRLMLLARYFSSRPRHVVMGISWFSVRLRVAVVPLVLGSHRRTGNRQSDEFQDHVINAVSSNRRLSCHVQAKRKVFDTVFRSIHSFELASSLVSGACKSVRKDEDGAFLSTSSYQIFCFRARLASWQDSRTSDRGLVATVAFGDHL